MITFKFNDLQLISVTKQKDIEVINNIIIELAKENNWLSRKDLEIKVNKKYQTIKNYLTKDINHLIDTEDFKELRKRNIGGHGNTYIEKYKLKTGLDTLLTVFDALKDKKNLLELMQTDYFKNHLPLIQDKLKQYVNIDNDFNSFVNSPTAIFFILKLNPDSMNTIYEEFKRITSNKNIKKLNYSQDQIFSLTLQSIALYDIVN